MKTRALIAVAMMAGTCAGLDACGHHSGGTVSTPTPPTPPPPAMTTTLGVNDVLMKARMQSETDDPFDVNGGMVALTPVNDEQSDPIAVE